MKHTLFLSLLFLVLLATWGCQRNPSYYRGISFDNRYAIVGVSPLSQLPKDRGYYTIWYDAKRRPLKITYQISNTLHPDPSFGVEQITFTYTPTNETRVFLDSSNQPKHSPSQGYAIAILDYDGKEQANSVRYYSSSNTPATDMRNAFTYTWVRDHKHRILRSTGRNTNGEIVEYMGIATVEWVYDKHGNMIEQRYYNKEGSLTSRTFFGYAIEKRTYDSKKRLIEQAYYDEHGNPVNYNLWHIHKYRYLYDRKGKLTNTIRYQITNGELVPLSR